MSAVLDVVAAVLLLAGALLAIAGAMGVVRLRDPLAAMHASTKPATLGVVLCGLSAAAQVDDLGSIGKVAVIIAVQLTTAPIGAHMLSRALSGRGEPGETVGD